MEDRSSSQKSSSGSLRELRTVPTAVISNRLFTQSQYLGSLQVGDHTTSNTHNVSRCRTEVVVPRSGCGPHLVVLQQVRIDEHTQLSAVTKRRYATFGFGNPKGGPPFRTTHPSGGEDLDVVNRSERPRQWSLAQVGYPDFQFLSQPLVPHQWPCS